ncbi:MAG: hypothetical protein ABI378_09760 [Chitinophagaceae bacterium]
MEDATINNEEEKDEQTPEQKGHKRGGIHNNALFAAGMGRAATAAVNPHNTSALAQTGTNASYEGPTSLNAGGTAGAGFGVNQSAVDSSTKTNLGYLDASEGQGKENNDDTASNANHAEDEKQE